MKRKCAAFAACALLLVLCACQGTPTAQDESNRFDSAGENSGVATAAPEAAPPTTETVTPDTTPTGEPDSGSASESTPESAPGAVPEPISPAVSSEQLEAYFQDTVFIGDSIMEGVRRYVAQNRTKEPTLGNAQFLTSTIGVSVGKLLDNENGGPFYRYNGQNQFLLQILPQMECKRIFLQLGLNDMAEVDPVVEDSIEEYSQLIDLLQDTVPNAEIIVITNPPKVASAWLPDYTPNRNFGNALIGEFVDALIQMCQSREIPYVDVHTALQNENGVLPDNYCSDGFVHLTEAGSKVVVEELYRFAAERIG